jgi:hypothetical protein
MSYIILRGRWCDIIVLNVHAPTEEKIDDLSNNFPIRNGLKQGDALVNTVMNLPVP